jgi:hypothetical protein
VALLAGTRSSNSSTNAWRGRLPAVPQRPEVDVVDARQAEQRRVDAPGAGSREDVDVHRHVEQVEQPQVDRLGVGVGPVGGDGGKLRERCAPVRRALQEVQLARHAAHPDREAHAPGHHRGEAKLLRLSADGRDRRFHALPTPAGHRGG